MNMLLPVKCAIFSHLSAVSCFMCERQHSYISVFYYRVITQNRFFECIRIHMFHPDAQEALFSQHASRNPMITATFFFFSKYLNIFKWNRRCVKESGSDKEGREEGAEGSEWDQG